MNYLVLILLLSQKAWADDQQPLPPNPFANLPTAQEAGSNPFADGAAKRFSPPKGLPSRPGAEMSRPGQEMTAPRAEATNLPAAAAKHKGDPANSKEIVENFDYPDAEIIDVAKAVSKLTGKNFIYNAQDIKGKISIVSETAITVGDAWNAFLTALNMKGFALIPSGKYLRIDKLVNAKEKQTPIYSDKSSPNNDEYITRVIPLRYIDAMEFQQAFNYWMPREARLQAYAQTNTLIITDTASHIQRMVELIGLLDVAGYQETLVVIPIKNAAAKDIAKLVEQIINDQKGGAVGTPGATYYPPRPNVGYSTPYNARPGGTAGERGARGGSTISKIIADDRTNCLIVKANATGIAEVRSLVRRLDTKIAAGGDNSGNIHVIRLQFADAEELAKTLSNITSSTAGKSAAGGGAPSPFPTYLSSQTQSSAFQSEIKVSADKVTQSLVVTCSSQDFGTLKKVVEQLDIPQDQVFVQAIIMEVALNRLGNYGTSFISASNGIELPAASGALQQILSGNPFTSGFSLGFRSGGTRAGLSPPSASSSGGTSATTAPALHGIDGLIEMVQANTDTNIVATPQLVALDNKESQIEISQSIPQPQQQATTIGTTTSFTQDTAALLLKLTPRINKASNYVKLDIEQKLENFDSSNVPVGLLNQATGKNSRQTKTSVIVENDDTVVLSGLMRTDVQKVVQKVPILGDIPILGWLFKSTKNSNVKTNLVIFITPTIVKQYATMRKILKGRIDDREDFVHESIGRRDPEDAGNKTIDKIQKNLPNLDEINPLPAPSTSEEKSAIPSPASPNREEDEMENVLPPPEPGIISPGFIPEPETGAPPAFQPMDNAPPPPVIPAQPTLGE